MQSGSLFFLSAFVLALTGCTRGMPLADIQYDCQSDGAGLHHRALTIGPNREGPGVVLTDAGRRQILPPVSGAGGRLFASPLYAWKGDGATGTLTDVEAIQSFTCRRTGSVAPSLVPSVRAAR